MSKLKTVMKLTAAAAAIAAAGYGIKYATAPAYEGEAGLPMARSMRLCVMRQ